MYQTKTAVGRGYTVMYPVFEGEGYGTVNRFYESFRDLAAEYFESLVAQDRHSVCRSAFSVEDDGDVFEVRLTLTLRRCGKRCGEKTLTHRWRRWAGRDAVMEK